MDYESFASFAQIGFHFVFFATDAYNDYSREHESQAHRLFIEYYLAHLPGVPRDAKDRHETQLATNKHWIEWVDDGLSERADVGSKKARAALPASLR